jgi:catechol 2,3-dioxygenase-like lactoylglutathione lyase family enzyme
MYDHIGLRVKSLDESVRFYEGALETLGYELVTRDESYAGFGPEGAAAFWLHAHPEGKRVGGVHVAFSAKSRRAVDAFHTEGLQAGGRDNGAPGVRMDYSPKYYAAFLQDPDGNNVEVVCAE